MRTLTAPEWRARGSELYGPDMRDWKFRCVACGHVQSHNLAKERNPDIGDTSSWIYFSCEGRHNPAVGCDWTLGGLFQIHELEVVKEDGQRCPCFEFAGDPPSAKPYMAPREDPINLRATDYAHLKRMTKIRHGDRALVYATEEVWKFDKTSTADPNGTSVIGRPRRRGRWLLEARS